jgi:uncharacterized membrane protein YgaE (UPF0421/DUF939 family)
MFIIKKIRRMKRLVVYIAKCITAVLISFLLARLLHYNDYIWGLISMILVLSPDGTDALTLATGRIKANLIGAGAGLIMLLIHPATVIMVAGAVAITVIVCYFLKLENPTRSALAASIIVTLHESGPHIWDIALERVMAVLSGCILGLLITYAFHSRFITWPAEVPVEHGET